MYFLYCSTRLLPVLITTKYPKLYNLYLFLRVGEGGSPRVLGWPSFSMRNKYLSHDHTVEGNKRFWAAYFVYETTQTKCLFWPLYMYALSHLILIINIRVSVCYSISWMSKQDYRDLLNSLLKDYLDDKWRWHSSNPVTVWAVPKMLYAVSI